MIENRVEKNVSERSRCEKYLSGQKFFHTDAFSTSPTEACLLFSKTLDWANSSDVERGHALRRPALADAIHLRLKVAEIISAVRSEGDSALRKFTRDFDRVSVEDFRVGAEEIDEAKRNFPDVALSALKTAKSQIEAFHEKGKIKDYKIETIKGVVCERQSRPIQSVGLYVPGGTAPLPSSVLMMGVPSQIVGCPTRVLCTPPRSDGSVDPSILCAADLCGITQIYRVGGAQAIAAMAFGTQSVPKIEKIFGPGNSFVTQAKILASLDPSGASCDLPAGPSEVLVIADSNARADFIASDLLSQAEHSADSQVVFVSICKRKILEVQCELTRQLPSLPRKETAEACLKNSVLIFATDVPEAIEISNQYAPEHLILHLENPREHIPKIQNAGSVFLGPWSPESVGDYASGTNHVLPTYGFARTYSGLSTSSFQKQITFQELSPAGLFTLGPTVETLAALEGLDAHKNAVTLRMNAVQASENLRVGE